MVECITGVWHAKAINRRLWFIIGMEQIFWGEIIEKKEKRIEDEIFNMLSKYLICSKKKPQA